MWAAAILAVAAPLASVTPGFQAVKRDASVSPEVRALVRQAISSIGLILVRNSSDSPGQGPRPRGSAVVVRADGVIVTNNHVITNTRTNRVYDEVYFALASSDGETLSSSARFRTRPLLINKEYDLALLKVESDITGKAVGKSFTFPTIEIGDSKKIKLLDDLFIIGFPERGGTTVTVNRGVVEGKDILGQWIKTDARVIHGNSGGAAVTSDGKLIGIPSKVEADEQPIDRDGDGFPDDYRRYGAVGFLRPAHLVSELLGQLGKEATPQPDPQPVDNKRALAVPKAAAPRVTEPATLVTVRGVVKSTTDGKPIAGALVGLLVLGETDVTESNLLTWGSSNADGEFKLGKPVPPGRYTLKAKAIARLPFTGEVEIVAGGPSLIVQMRAP